MGLQRVVSLLDQWEKTATRVLNFLVATLFIIIFLSVFTLVILRYVFSSSILGAIEVNTFLFSYVSILGVCLVHQRNSHIRIGYFTGLLPRPLQRGILMLNQILIILLSVVMLQRSIPWIISTSSFSSPISGTPYWLERISIPLGSAFLIFYSCLQLFFLVFSPGRYQWDKDSHDREDPEFL